MRQAVYTIAVVAIIAATATAIQQNADAALYTLPVEPKSQALPLGDLPELMSRDNSLQFESSWYSAELAPYKYAPPPTTYFNPLQFAPVGTPKLLGGSGQFKPIGEPPQAVALGEPEKVAPRLPNRALKAPMVRIGFNGAALPPMAYSRFCVQYPSECKIHKIVFRGGAIKLSVERRAELVKVNAEVNNSIAPEPNTQGLAAEKWLISPKSGECHDYAVTKRHDLVARGWPARSLLLAEVITSSGEHHLVLVVRTSEGDLVADNLNPNIRNWSKTHYEWVRIQSPENPTFWSKVVSVSV